MRVYQFRPLGMSRFYSKYLSGKRDSDPRPRPWQGRALPTELLPHFLTLLVVRSIPLNASAKVLLFSEPANFSHLFFRKNAIKNSFSLQLSLYTLLYNIGFLLWESLLTPACPHYTNKPYVQHKSNKTAITPKVKFAKPFLYIFITKQPASHNCPCIRSTCFFL